VINDNHTHLQICNLCEAMCGLNIQTHHGKIVSIKGNLDDPFSKGHMCAKALALKDIHEHKDRLRQPVRRTPQGWEPISWGAAFEEIEKELNTVKKKYGDNSVALYMGNPRIHHHGSLLTSILLRKSLNSRNCFSVASSDHLPHMLAAYHLFGHMALLPVPDIDRTDYLLCFGANPLVSNASVMSAPYIKKRLKAVQDRGGKIITIDPRKTETAEVANRHIFIYPGQDTFLLLAMIHSIFENDWVDQGEWQSYTSGVERLKEITRAFDIEKAAKKTGIARDIIETLACEFATAKRAAAYGRFGVCTQKHGAINAWLLYVLNIITGNLDQEGGIMFPTPAVDLALLSAIINEDGRFNDFQSQRRHLPSFDAELPVVEMADAMLSSDADSIKAFINISGNPVLSTPDGKKLEAALGQLDFMVAVDGFINETNRLATIILPPTSVLERSQYNMTCNLTAVRNNARYSEPLFSPADGAKHDWQILLQLSDILNRGYSVRSFSLRSISFIFKKLGPDGVLDFMLRLGPYGMTFRKHRLANIFKTHKKTNHPLPIAESHSPKRHQNKLQMLFNVSPFSKRMAWLGEKNSENERLPLTLKNLKSYPNGLDLGAMISTFPGRLFTADKTINLTPDIYLSELMKLSIMPGEINSLAEGEFYLIGRRTPRSMNSWLNRVERLTKGKPSNTLLMNPENARCLNLSAGDRVRVESAQQHIVADVELCSSIMKDVISLPHGWSGQLQVEKSGMTEGYPGTSFNDLTSSDDFDVLSGTSVLNSLVVKVSKGRADDVPAPP
jgi:anaerobic selenocysteine-containing dehydrogenase